MPSSLNLSIRQREIQYKCDILLSQTHGLGRRKLINQVHWTATSKTSRWKNKKKQRWPHYGPRRPQKWWPKYAIHLVLVRGPQCCGHHWHGLWPSLLCLYVCGRHYIGSNYRLPVGQVNFASELYQHLFSSDTPLISDRFTVHRRLQQIIYLFSVVNFTFWSCFRL